MLSFFQRISGTQPYTTSVGIAGWVLFALSQVVIAGAVIWSIWWGAEAEGAPLVVTGLVTAAGDVLVLTGTIGPGIPLPPRVGGEMLVAGIGVLTFILVLLGIDFSHPHPDFGTLGAGFAGLMIVGLVEWALIVGVMWPHHLLTGGPPTPTVTIAVAPKPAPIATITVTTTPGSTPVATLVAPTAANSPSTSGGSITGILALVIGAVGAIGGLLSGVAAWRKKT